MANTFTINVTENFSLDVLSSKLRDSFQAQGFGVTTTSISPTNTKIVFEKDCGGINMLLGMGQGITANCNVNGSVLYVNYSDGDWTGKIIGLAAGWILCWVPFITAIIGCVKQNGLPQKINSEITMIMSNM